MTKEDLALLGTEMVAFHRRLRRLMVALAVPVWVGQVTAIVLILKS